MTAKSATVLGPGKSPYSTLLQIMQILTLELEGRGTPIMAVIGRCLTSHFQRVEIRGITVYGLLPKRYRELVHKRECTGSLYIQESVQGACTRECTLLVRITTNF